MEINYNTPAFPIDEETTNGQMGMTLLDYFAAKAMQAAIPYENYRGLDDSEIPAMCSRAYHIASEMIKERKKYIK